MAEPSTAAVPAPPSGWASSWSAGTVYHGRSEHFLNDFAYGSTTVDEEVGSSHKMGVGVAVTGGSWSASGSYTVESHSSAGGDVDYTGNNALYNSVAYRHYTTHCYKDGGSVWYYRHDIQSPGLDTLLSNDQPIAAHAFPYADCTYYYKGNFHKTSGSNVTYAAGVDAPFINLSAEASFSKDTSVTWHIPSVGAMFCGAPA